MNISLKNKIAIFDLDGTIIDIKDSYFRVIQEFLLLKGIKYEIGKYLNDRVKYNSDSEILNMVFGLNNSDIVNFRDFKLKRIEESQYLSLDIVKSSGIELMRLLKNQGYRIELLTARRFFNNLITQLESLEILQYFDNVLMWPKDLLAKGDYIKLIENRYNEIMFFGDSLDDYLATQGTSSTFYLVADTIVDQTMISLSALTIDQILEELESRSIDFAY